MVESLPEENSLFSAEEGWLQLERYLDIYLPVNKPRKKRIAALLPATFCTVTFCFCFFILNKHQHSAKKHQLSFFDVVSERAEPHVSETNLKKGSSTINILASSFHPGKNYFNFPPNINVETYVAEKAIIYKPLIHAVNVPVFDNQSITAAIMPGGLSTNEKPERHQSVFKVPCADSIISDSGNNRHFNAAVGIAMNASLNADEQPVLPYPVVQVSYQLNRLFYITGGVSLMSPVSGQICGVSKSIFINDSLNNVQYLQESTRYNKLRYADIPLSIGIRLSKSISLESGIQFSVLMSRQKTKTYEILDNQLISRNTPVQATLLAPNRPPQYFPVTIRSLDARFTASINYHLQHVSIGLGWQQGLGSAGNTVNGPSSKNQIFSLRGLVRLW